MNAEDQVKQVDSHQAKTALDADSTAQLVDVREEWEWSQGHVPGAVHIPLGDVPYRYEELDPSRPVYVVCAGGMRSYEAACFLVEHGFGNVTNLAEGTMGWAQSGLALEFPK